MTAYKPTFIRDALVSVLAQTWKNFELIICDDSPDDRIGQIVASLADPRIRYEKNPTRLGSQQNYVRVFSAARGDFCKFVCDDDRLAPDCVERMVRCLQAHPDVTLVTSARDLIDEQGKVQPPIGATRRVCTEDSRMDGALMVHQMLESRTNFIGEPTTVMFRRVDLAWVRPHLICYKGMPATGNGDVTKWLNLLGRGDAIYLTEPLSQFRVHSEQAQRVEPRVFERGVLAWELNRSQATDLGNFLSGSVPDCVPAPLGGRPWRLSARGEGEPRWQSTDMDLAEDWAGQHCRGQVSPAVLKQLVDLSRRFPNSIRLRFQLVSALLTLGLLEQANKVWSTVRELCPPIRPMSGVSTQQVPYTIAPVAVFTLVSHLPSVTALIQISTVEMTQPTELTLTLEGSEPLRAVLPAGQPMVEVSLPVDPTESARSLVLRWSRSPNLPESGAPHLIGLGAMLRRPLRG
jgi:hypothetical protein